METFADLRMTRSRVFSRVLASQRDAMKIARHFSAGYMVGDDHSPVGTAETRVASAVPTENNHARLFPALKVQGYYRAAPTGRGQHLSIFGRC